VPRAFCRSQLRNPGSTEVADCRVKREPMAEPSRCLVGAFSSEREYSELGTKSGPLSSSRKMVNAASSMVIV
jgi:hypothetical protein